MPLSSATAISGVVEGHRAVEGEWRDGHVSEQRKASRLAERCRWTCFPPWTRFSTKGFKLEIQGPVNQQMVKDHVTVVGGDKEGHEGRH